MKKCNHEYHINEDKQSECKHCGLLESTIRDCFSEEWKEWQQASADDVDKNLNGTQSAEASIRYSCEQLGIEESDIQAELVELFFILRQEAIEQTIDYISFKEGWEETGDKYRKEFNIKPKYSK
jgi:hypothetical protein